MEDANWFRLLALLNPSPIVLARSVLIFVELAGQTSLLRMLPIEPKRGDVNEKMARRGGFEPPRPCGHRISNPAPYRAGPPPL